MNNVVVKNHLARMIRTQRPLPTLVVHVSCVCLFMFGFSVWFVCGYAHVFILIYVVIVTTVKSA